MRPITRRTFCLGLSNAYTARAFALNTPAALQLFPKLGRGVNIHNVFNWPEIVSSGTTGADYVWPPFQGAKYCIDDIELQIGF